MTAAETVTLRFSPAAMALRAEVGNAVAAEHHLMLRPDQLGLLLGEALPEPVREAYGDRPADCPEVVWRMLVLAGDLADGALPALDGTGAPFDARRFLAWAESAWREASR